MLKFSVLVPYFGARASAPQYFAQYEGKKKKMKHIDNNIYYFCDDRKKIYVEISGSLYAPKFTVLDEGAKKWLN